MTNATIAARIVAGGILGRAEEDEDLFDPSRSDVLRHPGRFLSLNAKVAAHWVGDRLGPSDEAPTDLRPGEAAVLEVDGDLVAVHRDDRGTLHAVDATCTHLGCTVAWNTGASTWDCPCHGSRFDVDGAVVASPATKPLADRSDLIAEGT
jgi:nitrite reductase/ring-hydroxylating ferredoxin subunit